LGHIGWCHYRLNNYYKSIEFNQKALALAPNQLWIQCNLALATLHTGEVETAKKHYEKAVGLAENTAEFKRCILVDLREALEKNPDLEGGREVLEWLEGWSF
ncbi:MAG: tetratricopeptide repeat protein, partial [Chitinophagales bacterium]